MKKPKPLSPQNVQMYQDALEHYENLVKKAKDESVTYDELEILVGAKQMLLNILWEDRHIILKAYRTMLKK